MTGVCSPRSSELLATWVGCQFKPHSFCARGVFPWRKYYLTISLVASDVFTVFCVLICCWLVCSEAAACFDLRCWLCAGNITTFECGESIPWHSHIAHKQTTSFGYNSTKHTNKQLAQFSHVPGCGPPNNTQLTDVFRMSWGRPYQTCPSQPQSGCRLPNAPYIYTIAVAYS